MNYRNLVNPELRCAVKKTPYNKFTIACANVAQSILLKMTQIPFGVNHTYISVAGYKGLLFHSELFEPKNVKEKLPCLIYVHGGAFSFKASSYHKKLACLYAEKAHCRVLFPDYHLIPKYSFPAAYQDVLALYRWIAEHAEELAIDPHRIAVGGDSAGGAITALICNTYESQGLPMPCAQMLLYPVTDSSMTSESLQKFPDAPHWDAKSNKKMWDFYLKHTKQKERKNASPMHNILPTKIPNTYMETAEFDCLRDEGIFYAKKLEQAGARLFLNDTKGTIHAYDAALHTDIVHQNIKKRLSFLEMCFNM